MTAEFSRGAVMLEPGSSEVRVVTAVTIVGMLVALAWLATGVVLRRRRMGPPVAPAARKRPPADPVFGLGVLVALAAFGAGLVNSLEFVHGPGLRTLFGLHGRAEPVYWIAWVLGSGLLVILTAATVKFRRGVGGGVGGWVIGGPALLVAALTLLVPLAISVKLRRADARYVAAELPRREPGINTQTIGVFEGLGWTVAVVSVLLLGLVVVLACCRRQELWIAIGFAVATAIASAASPLVKAWALIDGEAVRIWVWPVEQGPWAILVPLAFLVMAGLVIAVPFLPPWVRGIVALVAVASPIWLGFAGALADHNADPTTREMLRSTGATVAYNTGYMTMMLPTMLAMVAVPIVAFRGWRANRRRTATPPTVPTSYPVGAPA
jgi:hypothetical protein